MRNKEGALLAAAAAFVLVGAGRQAKLPAAVAKAVEENRPGAEIDTLEIEKEGGFKLYDIEFKNGRGEIEVAEDGTVLDVSDIVDMKDIPAAAAAAIRNEADGRTIKQVEKSEVRAKIAKEGGKGRLSKLASPEYVYEAELSKGEVEVAADGRLIKGLKGEVKP
jgi:hypothetical protein